MMPQAGLLLLLAHSEPEGAMTKATSLLSDASAYRNGFGRRSIFPMGSIFPHSRYSNLARCYSLTFGQRWRSLATYRVRIGGPIAALAGGCTQRSRGQSLKRLRKARGSQARSFGDEVRRSEGLAPQNRRRKTTSGSSTATFWFWPFTRSVSSFKIASPAVRLAHAIGARKRDPLRHASRRPVRGVRHVCSRNKGSCGSC
jgi:hypothetical protein